MESNEIIEKNIIDLQTKIRDIDLEDTWTLLDYEQRKNKENELKSKIHDLHPLKNLNIQALTENKTEDEDYVIFLVNLKYIALVNLTCYDYIPREYQIGYIAFRDFSEMINYIKDGNFVV